MLCFDLQKIYPIYQNADVVVLASPMYYHAISGQLKCAFDRLFAIAELSPDYVQPKKECVLLMATEEDTEWNFAPVKAYYKGLLTRIGWTNSGAVYAGGNTKTGDILNKSEQLRQAEELGKSI